MEKDNKKDEHDITYFVRYVENGKLHEETRDDFSSAEKRYYELKGSKKYDYVEMVWANRLKCGKNIKR